MTTNVPPVQFTAAGLVLPTEQAILDGVLADIDAAFGGGVNLGLTSPQGQLASSEAAVIGARNDELLLFVNMFDPAYSSGRYQDALGRIYGLTRREATASSATCTCVGQASTIIPAGALATDGTNVWSCVEGGTIPIGGSISLLFECLTSGPVAAPAHSINTIYQTISGWDTIDNPADAVLGSDVETRYEFEERRQQTLQANSQATIAAMVGAVLEVPGVTDAYGYANDTAGSETITGVVIGTHQVFVAVEGGTDALVAETLWSKKPPGSPWWSSASTTVTVEDTGNGYSPPYPSYTVKFERPAALPILFDVEITNSSQAPADAATQVQNAIIAAFAGSDGGPRARIGSLIYASRFYAPVAALGSWARIISIKVGTSSANADDVQVPIDEIPTVASSDITVNLV